jgi:hypothetical protein
VHARPRVELVGDLVDEGSPARHPLIVLRALRLGCGA